MNWSLPRIDTQSLASWVCSVVSGASVSCDIRIDAPQPLTMGRSKEVPPTRTAHDNASWPGPGHPPPGRRGDPCKAAKKILRPSQHRKLKAPASARGATRSDGGDVFLPYFLNTALCEK